MADFLVAVKNKTNKCLFGQLLMQSTYQRAKLEVLPGVSYKFLEVMIVPTFKELAR